MGMFSIFKKSNTAFIPGCTAFFKFNKSFELYKKIFSKLGIDFVVLDKHISSGLEALEAGYELEARELARKNFEVLIKEGINSIITASPACYKMFLQNYPEIVPNWNIEVKNLWELILKKLEEKEHLVKNRGERTITYHDSCYLGRYCKIYDEPRKILEFLGYEIKEMSNSRENSFCCGSCGGLPFTNKLLADKIAKERIMQAKRIGMKEMVVIGFENYSLLKENSDNTGVRIIELSEILADSLAIKKMESEKEVENKEETEKILIKTKPVQDELVEDLDDL